MLRTNENATKKKCNLLLRFYDFFFANITRCDQKRRNELKRRNLTIRNNLF